MTDKAMNRVQSERGITMIEILVVIVITAGVLMSLAAAMGLAYSNIGRSTMDTDAYAASQAKLEQLVSMDYDSISTGSGDLGGYEMQWTVTGTDPKQLVFELFWTNRAGVQKVDRTVLFYPKPDGA
jgi:type II secretory pathway pseudopilin PulG